MSDPTRKAIDVKRKYEKSWMDIDGVVAVGVGMKEDRPAILVSVEKNPEIIRKQIPASIEGVPVDIRETGAIRAQ